MRRCRLPNDGIMTPRVDTRLSLIYNRREAYNPSLEQPTAPPHGEGHVSVTSAASLRADERHRHSLSQNLARRLVGEAGWTLMVLRCSWQP